MLRRLSTWVVLLIVLGCAEVRAADVDNAFLDDLQQRSFRFFWEEADPATGLIADRAGADGQKHYPVASIASVGFGLTAICIADHRGWVSHTNAYERVLNTLRFAVDRLPNEHGFFYHFVDRHTGERAWKCEVSSLDTALLLAGALTVREYFPDTEAAALAVKLYERVDWPWMLNGGATFSMGWNPETGFLSDRWNEYSEHMILDLLAMGSATHPVSAETWHAWRRSDLTSYGGMVFLRSPALFTYQYSHAWIDFRDKRDAYADYWRNSVLATEAHRQFCLDLRAEFPKFSENLWGITASDSAKGYQSWGGPPAAFDSKLDGTVVPCAAGGSIPFLPKECLATLEYMRNEYGERVWKRYGFVDAFNPQNDWTAGDVIGIDAGITLVMAENFRTGLVWEQFMKNPEIQRGMDRAGFHSTARELAASDRDYLKQVSREAWKNVRSQIDPESGLPCRTGEDEGALAGTVGFYLSDIVAAREMNFLDAVDAEGMAALCLKSLGGLAHEAGLPMRKEDHWISASDAATLAAGLITVGQAFPNLHETCTRRLMSIDWTAFYDTSDHRLCEWFNTLTDRCNPRTQVISLGSGARFATFFAVATGQAPPGMWDDLKRETEDVGHARFLAAGPADGLLAQYQDGLWLEDQGTLMRLSARNYAFAELSRAAMAQLPAWGWPGLTGNGETAVAGGRNDHLVSPAACAMAVDDYPRLVTANLRALEKLGARRPELGFATTIDVVTKQMEDGAPVLHQSLLLLSLANYLQDHAVQRWFQADPLVQRGRRLVKDFQVLPYGPNTAVLTPGSFPADVRLRPQKTIVAHRFHNWQVSDWQTMNSQNALESGAVTGTSAQFAFAWDETALRFAMKVHQPKVWNDRSPEKLYEQDCVELFISSHPEGLRWGNPADYQFGFAVGDKTWEWFGQGRHIQATVKTSEDGYAVEAAIPWEMLGSKPVTGQVLQVSPAVRSMESSNVASKLNWNWQPQGSTIQLGRLLVQ